MKRIGSFVILALLLTCGSLHAQQKTALSTQSTTTCAAPAASYLSIGLGAIGQPGQFIQPFGGATITVSANASGNTVSFVASGDGGTTWVALNATPSNSTTAATSTTSTGTWQANVAGYTNVCAYVSTLVSGSATVSIVPSTASARAGVGGSGTTTNQVTNGIPVNTNGTATALNAVVCTPPAVAGQYTVGYFPTSAAAVAPTCPQVGMTPDQAAGATVLYSDNNNVIYNPAAALSLPTPTTLGNTNFYTTIINNGSASTITPVTWTISLNGAAGGSTAIVGAHTKCSLVIDQVTSTQWDLDCTPMAGLSGMTAGQVAIAATATTVTSSAALQGTDASILTSGTISGSTSVPLCTDAKGGATTSSCPAPSAGVPYGAGGGSVNVMTVTTSPVVATNAAGTVVEVLPNLANTTTTPTLNVGGAGAQTVTKNGAAAVAAGDYSTTANAIFLSDGTHWQLLNPQTFNSNVAATFGPATSSSASIAGVASVAGAGGSSGNLALKPSQSGGQAYLANSAGTGLIACGTASNNCILDGPLVLQGTGSNTFGGAGTLNLGACETNFGPTTLSGATTTTGLSCLPASSIILSVQYRITTTITTATSFTIGDAGSATRYCGTQSTLTSGTTGICIAAGYYFNSGALGILITPNTTPGAGAIRLIVTYLTLTAPTS